MSNLPPTLYRVREFAARAGVTVRTLHYYDRLELLPPVRSRSGYRLYGESDLRRLEKIAALKFFGLPLSRIRHLLQNDTDLGDALRDQLQRLAVVHDRLSVAMTALGRATGLLSAGRTPDWSDLAKAIRKLRNNDQPEAVWREHQLDTARKKIWSRRLQWSATLQDYELARDVRTAVARGESPSSPVGTLLVARWRDSVERFTSGDPELRRALEIVIDDRRNWPSPADEEGFLAFFRAALQTD
jgi:DNA-binding transcriptional MerR regulator